MISTKITSELNNRTERQTTAMKEWIKSDSDFTVLSHDLSPLQTLLVSSLQIFFSSFFYPLSINLSVLLWSVVRLSACFWLIVGLLAGWVWTVKVLKGNRSCAPLESRTNRMGGKLHLATQGNLQPISEDLAVSIWWVQRVSLSLLLTLLLLNLFPDSQRRYICQWRRRHHSNMIFFMNTFRIFLFFEFLIWDQ